MKLNKKNENNEFTAFMYLYRWFCYCEWATHKEKMLKKIGIQKITSILRIVVSWHVNRETKIIFWKLREREKNNFIYSLKCCASFFSTQCVYVCAFLLSRFFVHFSLVVAISFILIVRCLRCGECWTIRKKKKKKLKHCRVCLQQFGKMRSCKWVLLYGPHIEFADSICAAVWLYVFSFMCARVCVLVCVRAWMSDDGKTNKILFLL